jgi:hypothetical protein
MTDLVRWDLCGPVRTLGARVAEWNREADDWRPMKSRFVATFRPDGSLSEIANITIRTDQFPAKSAYTTKPAG